MSNNGILYVKYIDKAIVLVISFFLLLLSYSQIDVGIANRLEETTSFGINNNLILIVIFCFIVFLLFYRKKYINLWLGLLFAYLVLGYLIGTTHSSFRNIFSTLTLMTFWVFCFSFGGRLVDVNETLSSFFIKTINIIVVLPLSLFCIYKFFTTNLIMEQHTLDAFFALIVYFPFVLMMEKNTILKTILFVLLLIVAVLSFKRSIIIGVLVCSLVYVLFSYTERKKLFSKWYFWLLLVGIIVSGYYIYGIVSETILYRFDRLEEDGGSGRDYIYKLIISSVQQSNWQEVLFGHGYQSVRTINNLMLAHNDLLQLLYDFGIIGMCLYLFFLLSMIILAIKKFSKYKSNKTLYAAFVSSIVLFLILSFLNCFIYSTMFIAPIMLALGIMDEKVRFELS